MKLYVSVIIAYVGLFSLSSLCHADYSKVANNGSPLPASAQLGAQEGQWACTYDSQTRLMWEIKTNDSGLRDKRWSYSWFNSKSNVASMMPGVANGGECVDQTNCDTEKFIEQVNQSKLCGADNWRLPTIDELKSLINPAYIGSLNPWYFPDGNVRNAKVFGFWSALEASDVFHSKAYYLLFEKALALEDFKVKPHRLRLVRDVKNFTPSTAPEVWLEDFNDKVSAGVPHGISYGRTLTGRGAVFLRANESRIQYPFTAGFPKSGTIEFRLNLKSAYRYDNFTLLDNEACALIFTSNTVGPGNEPPPGGSWFYACKNGTIVIQYKTFQGREPVLKTLSAKSTRFRFNEWHIISFSYGKNGQAIAVDGAIVAEAQQNNQELDEGADQQSVAGMPTLGEAVSSGWKNNQYDVGFEGIIDTVRVSKVSKDWILGLDRPINFARLAAGSFKKPNRLSTQAVPILVNDFLQRHLFGKLTDQNWFQFIAKKGLRYTIEIPNDSVGNALNPGIEIFNVRDKLEVALINNRGSGEGEEYQWTAPETGLYRLRITNQPPFTRQNNSDSLYEVRIYLTDQPQQGIIKGRAINSCSNTGVHEAEISAWLGDIVTDSTLSYSTGEFSLPLNPDDYKLNSLADSYQNVSTAVSVNLDEITAQDLHLPPVVNCANYVAPVVDPLLLQQQAVAVYDEQDGSLIIRDLVADGKVYYLELHDGGDFRFQLDQIIELPNALHDSPGSYDFNSLYLELPSVYFSETSYRVTMKNDGYWVFWIEKVE